MDSRIEKLAKLLVEYSCSVKPGEKVLIEANGCDLQMVRALVSQIYAAGGHPFVSIGDSSVTRAVLNGISEEQARLMAKYDAYRMNEMDAYIGIRGGDNSYELSDVPSQNMHLYDKLYRYPVHHEIRVGKTKWVILRWPTGGMSQLAKMSTEAFEKFYFDVCTLDYAKMDKAMDALQYLLNRTDVVRLVAKDTDLTFSIKNIGSEKCSGLRNIPDGEVYTAPVKNSVNGHIHFNTPSIENGIEFQDVRLTFENGKIVEATANHTDKVNKIFNTDEGARYVGEFAIGVNPYITKPMGDILFDEKISGSIHFTPGCCYEEANNGNQSAIHWDLVLMQTPEYGGGEIWFDGELVRKDGVFVLQVLEGLNPENLK